MSVKQTFWQLLDSHKIEIPIIQRDYAQGRSDAKAEQIRISFVQSLHEKVTNTDLSQDLDFIYGSVNNGSLVLLDGQQRLTTLFLLHWYIAAGTGVIDKAKEKLVKFCYETRVSSREFIKSLLNISDGLIVADADEPISTRIIDAHWFFSVWRNDPTVQSMLTMLDEIDRVFKQDLLQGKILWEKLVCRDNPPVTFHFLEMQQFALTDELYIKMNARGRPLTEFENFKAWLQSYVDKSDDIEIPDTFWASMDKEWTDVFWRMREDGQYEIDELFLNCFKSIALVNVAKSINAPSDKLEEQDDRLITEFRGNSYISPNRYDESDCFKGNTLNKVCALLNLIHQLQQAASGTVGADVWKQCKSVFENALRNKGYRVQARFVALLFYVSNSNKVSLWQDSELEELVDWLGVAIRLINNTAFDNPADYVQAVQALREMSELIGDGMFMNRLSTLQAKDLNFFNEIQRNEEILKARLVVEDPSWRTILRGYDEEEEKEENKGQNYFYGQIGFLLEGCRDSASGRYCQKDFESLAKKAKVVFDDLIETDDFLLQRALLSLGDYLVRSGSNYSFCKKAKSSARDRNQNWRRVFNNQDRRSLLLELLDSLEEGKEREGLQVIINQANCQDWRQYFIKYPQAIAYCKARQVRFYGNEVYLLNSVRMSGWHMDLRTFALYLEIQDSNAVELAPLKEVMKRYHQVRKENDYPGVVFSPWQGGTLRVEYIKDDYVLSLFDDNEQEIQINDCREIDALKQIISDLKKLESAIEGNLAIDK